MSNPTPIRVDVDHEAHVIQGGLAKPGILGGLRIAALRERVGLNALAAVLLSILFAILLAKAATGVGPDFHVFYLAGERVLAGVSPYQVSDGGMPYKYHPVWSSLFAGSTVLPEQWSFVIFNAAQAACWYWTATIWLRWVEYRGTKYVALLLVFLFAANMLSIELGYGQVNGFLILASTKVLDWMEREHPLWFIAGATAAVIATVKLNFVLLCVYCLIKDVRAAAGFFAVAALFHLLIVASGNDGFELYRGWLTVISATPEAIWTINDAQGFFRLFYAGFGRVGAVVVWCGVVLLFLAGGVLLNRRGGARADVAAYWIAGVYLLSPHAWWYQALFMFPMIALLLHGDRISHWERWCLLAVLLVFAFVGKDVLGRDGFHAFKEAYGILIASLIPFALFVWRRLVMTQSPGLHGLTAAQPAAKR